MKNLGSDRKKAMEEELEKGRELACQLHLWIQKSNGGDDDKAIPYAQDLAERLVSSFSSTLLLLNLRPSEPDDVVSPLQDSSCLLQAKSEDTEDSCRSTSNVKERRGCYKRRRTATTWEKESEAPIDDGHAWRKYGQKIIMNTKYPRNYFRCTHKFDQECLATKQVQRIQEEPVLYRTTYYGHHTCNRNLLNPEIILDSGPASESSIFLSFDNSQNTLNTKHHQPFFSTTPSSSPLPKEPCKAEIPSPSSEDYLFSTEPMPLSSTLESHHGDVIPDDVFRSAELDDVFRSAELDGFEFL